MGIGREASILYVVDFGLSKQFFDPKRKVHMPFKDGKSLTGTARYASINAHLGYELSRRDDLLALGNMMIYLYKGELPWMNLVATTKSDRYRLIREIKRNTKFPELCEDCPS